MARAPLLVLAALVAGCGADDCSSVCLQQRGLWRAQTNCASPALAELRWQVEIGASAGECQIRATHCERTEMRTQPVARDCDSRLSSLQLGAAVCALTVGDREPSAVCRLSGKACDFTFVRDPPGPLSCATPAPRDGGPDVPVDAAADPGADSSENPSFDAGSEPAGDRDRDATSPDRDAPAADPSPELPAEPPSDAGSP